MHTPIERAEHEEFRRRMEEEHNRTNRRLQIVEEAVKENNKLVVAVEKMALNMESMLKEQRDQGERLEALENRDGEKWRAVSSHVVMTVIGLVIGYIFSQIM